MHREPEPERAADLAEVLHLLHAAPIVRIAQHDLYRVACDSGRQIGKAGDGNVAGQRRLHAALQQPLANFCHAIEPCCGVFKVALVRQFRLQLLADAHRSLHRPRTIRIEAQWDGRTKRGVELPNGLDLDVRLEYPGLQLDVAKAVLSDHLLRLAHDRLRRQCLAVAISACVAAFAATAAVFVEQVSSERNSTARAPTEQVTNGFLQRLADEIKTGDGQRRVEPCRFVMRVLARNAERLRAVDARSGRRLDKR